MSIEADAYVVLISLALSTATAAVQLIRQLALILIFERRYASSLANLETALRWPLLSSSQTRLRDRELASLGEQKQVVGRVAAMFHSLPFY